MATWIVRFRDEASRDKFVDMVHADRALRHVDLEVGEFLPDVIVKARDADEQRLRAMAPEALFASNIQFQVFQQKHA
jgi:hypothetical protein